MLRLHNDRPRDRHGRGLQPLMSDVSNRHGICRTDPTSATTWPALRGLHSSGPWPAFGAIAAGGRTSDPDTVQTSESLAMNLNAHRKREQASRCPSIGAHRHYTPTHRIAIDALAGAGEQLHRVARAPTHSGRACLDSRCSWTHSIAAAGVGVSWLRVLEQVRLQPFVPHTLCGPRGGRMLRPTPVKVVNHLSLARLSRP